MLPWNHSKTFGLVLLFVFLSIQSFTQNFDALINKPIPDCEEIYHTSSLYFVKYMKKNEYDSAQSLLKYWESKCGAIREPLFRAKILLAIKQNQFNDSLLDSTSLNNVFNYQNRRNLIRNGSFYLYDQYKNHYGFVSPGLEFDTYTHSLAKSLMSQFNEESIEYLLCEFYGANSDTILTKLQLDRYGKSDLIIDYRSELNRFIKMSEIHFSWITGVWIPTGPLSKLGVHPDFGFQVGTKDQKMNYDLIMSFRPLDSPNSFVARQTNSDNSLVTTNYFFGVHVGVDIGRDVFTYKKHEVQLTGGVAYDAFDVVEGDTENDIPSETVVSYNFNAGLAYRYYVTMDLYLSLRAKYNVVDYTLNNVIGFTGNPITIQFIVGGLSNRIKKNNLKSLGYKLRS